jgi:putative SOS response-associated peptidase YedK
VASGPRTTCPALDNRFLLLADMCGRYALYGPVSRHKRDAIEFLGCEIEFRPTYNAAPSQSLPVCRASAGGDRELAALRWGLVPFWARDASIGARMINARAETVAQKPAFRAAFARRRCIVPMSGFYEWRRDGSRKVPYFIRPLNSELFAAAGLFERWPGRDGAEPIESFTIITTGANELMRALHDRMPVLLQPAAFEAWLSPENRDVAALEHLLVPCPAEEMQAYPVSTRVNNARNDGRDLIAPQQ